MLKDLPRKIGQKWGELNKIKSFRYGVPFLIMTVGFSFGLKQFTALRYDYKQTKMLDPKEFEGAKHEMKPRGSVTLESEYEKIKEIDIDNWEPIRTPRPWEDNTEYEEKVLSKRKEKASQKREEAAA